MSFSPRVELDFGDKAGSFGFGDFLSFGLHSIRVVSNAEDLVQSETSCSKHYQNFLEIFLALEI
jgi:hypothetical protein